MLRSIAVVLTALMLVVSGSVTGNAQIALDGASVQPIQYYRMDESTARCGPGGHFHCTTDQYGRRMCTCISRREAQRQEFRNYQEEGYYYSPRRRASESDRRCGPGYHYHCGNDPYGRRFCGCVPRY